MADKGARLSFGTEDYRSADIDTALRRVQVRFEKAKGEAASLRIWGNGASQVHDFGSDVSNTHRSATLAP